MTTDSIAWPDSPRPLLSLVMMVKNEAASIKAVLESAKPFVDRWTILDTGSTDGTQDIIRETMSSLPGCLFETTMVSVFDTKGWEGFENIIDYAATRNKALDLAKDAVSQFAGPSIGPPAVFTLMLSGDEFLRDGAKFREQLEKQRDTDIGCFLIRLTFEENTLFSPRILRTDSPWRYEYPIHEFPANRVDAEPTIDTVLECGIDHVVSDHESRYETIFEKHIPVLEKLLEENPNDERALIFLAQSWEALLPFFPPEERITLTMKAMSYQIRRLGIPSGNVVERNYVMMHYLDNARITGIYTPEEFFRRCTEQYQLDPERPETALMCADAAVAAAKTVSILDIYKLYAHAAHVAAAARGITNSSSVSITCEWRAHYHAAVVARQIAAKKPDLTFDGKAYADLVKEHIAAGLGAGGQWNIFKLIENPTPTPEQSCAAP